MHPTKTIGTTAGPPPIALSGVAEERPSLDVWVQNPPERSAMTPTSPGRPEKVVYMPQDTLDILPGSLMDSLASVPSEHGQWTTK